MNSQITATQINAPIASPGNIASSGARSGWTVNNGTIFAITHTFFFSNLSFSNASLNSKNCLNAKSSVSGP